MSGRTTYWACGGDIFAWPCHRLSNADVNAMSGLHLDEVKAAARAGDLVAAKQARRLAKELSTALASALRWRRASGRVKL